MPRQPHVEQYTKDPETYANFAKLLAPLFAKRTEIKRQDRAVNRAIVEWRRKAAAAGIETSALEHEIVFRMCKPGPDRERYEEHRAIARRALEAAEAPEIEPIYSQSKRKESASNTRQMALV